VTALLQRDAPVAGLPSASANSRTEREYPNSDEYTREAGDDGTVPSSLLLIGGIALTPQAISPIPTYFSVAWSVCRLSVGHTLHPA